MIQKAAAIGKLVISQVHHNNAPAHASHFLHIFLSKRKITQVMQPPCRQDLAPCDCWLFPKLKAPLKGKRFQTVSEFQENTMVPLMVIKRTVWGPMVPTLKEPEVSLSYVQCLLYVVSSSMNVCFSYYMARYILDKPI